MAVAFLSPHTIKSGFTLQTTSSKKQLIFLSIGGFKFMAYLPGLQHPSNVILAPHPKIPETVS
jgi:hypothetical protein